MIIFFADLFVVVAEEKGNNINAGNTDQGKNTAAQPAAGTENTAYQIIIEKTD